MRKNKKSNIPLEVYCDDGETITEDHQEVLSRWARDFGSLLQPPTYDNEQQQFADEIRASNREREQQMKYNPRTPLNRSITIEDVHKIVYKCKNNKAPGLDAITYEVLKNDASVAALSKLFNYCFDVGMIPRAWARGIINPIPKSASSDPRVPLNYRGISLLPVISKVLTGLLADRVVGFLEKQNILANEQNGFRPDRSCLDHIFTLCDLVRTRKALKHETFCAFVDFQKAFDFVGHEFLKHKLLDVGVDGNTYNIISSIYSMSESCVLINDRLTDWFPVMSGVRQGDSLSPILFAIFINDLADEMKATGLGVRANDTCIPLLMYADDIVILGNSHEETQQLLDILSKWCHKWGMLSNIKKSQVVHCRTNRKPRNTTPLYLLGEPMQYVDNYKYLGCWLNEFSNDKKTVEALTAAAGRSYGRIVGLFKKLGDMDYNTFVTLFQSYVLPVANYGAAVWGFKDHQAPRVLQNKISRFYLGTHRFAPVPATALLMDLTCIQLTRWQEIIRYHNRIMSLKPDRLPRIVYEWEMTQGNKGWIQDVINITKVLHLPPPDSNVIYDMENVDYAIKAYSNKRYWNAVPTKSKLCSFEEMITKETANTLVKANLKRYPRSLLAKTLCGILPLEVETGRFTDIKREHRFCKNCNTTQVEDEYHFLFVCKALKKPRKEWLKANNLNNRAFKSLSSQDKARLLLQPESIKSLSVLVQELFMTRRNLIYKVV